MLGQTKRWLQKMLTRQRYVLAYSAVNGSPIPRIIDVNFISASSYSLRHHTQRTMAGVRASIIMTSVRQALVGTNGP